MRKVFCLLLLVMMFVTEGFALRAQKIISIDTKNTSLVLSVEKNGAVDFRTYGKRIENPDAFAAFRSNDDHHINMLVPAYTTRGGEYIGAPALSVTHADGGMNTELRYVSHETVKDDGVEKTTIVLHDTMQPLEVRLVYVAYLEEDVIESHSEIVNLSKKEILLSDYFSSSLMLNASKYLLTRFWGSWAHEFQVERTLLTHGVTSIEDYCGVRTTHKSNPSFMLSLDASEFSETSGEVVAGALKWSGNYKIDFYRDETGRLQIRSGINPLSSEWHLAKGETFVTPDMVYTFSAAGAGQASRNLHDWARRFGLYDATAVAPTLLNSWEGAYFAFDTKTLTDMMDDAASIGLEMFVLDDGWFANGEFARNSDKSGLGDWQLNTSKLPEGISYLAGYAHGKGLKFGIWIEPEMVNPKSELYLKHPDWVVNEPGRDIIPLRNQYLLDLSNPSVQDFVFGVFDSVMQMGDIDYIKWDCNRHVLNMGSSYQKNQSHFFTAYTLGLYNVLSRIREKYPKVMIQSCSSGGGRVDYGVLQYTNEVWTSDDTDATVRTQMQYGFSLIYPSMVMGSHISAVPNHQTHLVTGIKYRTDIASSGRLGVELQPKQMTAEEKSTVSNAVENYKSFRDIIYEGDLYRLQSPYDGPDVANIYVSKDKKRAVLFVYHTDYVLKGFMPQIRLQGLQDGASYKVTELNCSKSVFWGNGKSFDTDYLQNFGLNLKLRDTYSSAVFLLEMDR
ncbi:MAG: alpha-galactosidase [Bacteroidales bacterium]|nr:alpha-galactosidase [Bacteroidales bacterium]